MNQDTAYQSFLEKLPEWEENLDKIITEADTRFKVIDYILENVLGWNKIEDIQTEPFTKLEDEEGYIDYLFRSADDNIFLLEAKRFSNNLLETQGQKRTVVKVSGTVLKPAQEGIEQARRYCYGEGISKAGLTNGAQWVAFPPYGKGSKPGERKAIVFPTLGSIKDDFACFYDLFSKEGIANGWHESRINSAESAVHPSSEILTPAVRDEDVDLKEKSEVAHDLETILEKFFTEISGSKDPNMISKCFVETNESKDADVALSKISKKLISEISSIKTKKDKGLTKEIRRVLKSEQGEVILLVGRIGAGKTTYIDRFFGEILDSPTRNQCVVVRLDLKESTGESTGSDAERWINRRLIELTEKEIFAKRNRDFNALKGIFRGDYDRLKNGEWSTKYKTNSSEFEKDFGDFLLDLREQDPNGYLLKLLENIVTARQKLPCIVFDNSDHFSQEYQEFVFKFAQAIRARVSKTLIICPVTDSSVWRLSKTKAFSSYYTKSYFLPVPHVKDILDKRIEYMREQIRDHKRNRKRSSETRKYYFGSMSIDIESVEAFTLAIQEALITAHAQTKTLGMLANFGIRRCLEITRQVIVSPYIKTDEIIATYIAERTRQDRVHRYIKGSHVNLALINSKRSHFFQEENDFILNLFAVSPALLTSPLAKLSILKYLLDVHHSRSDVEEKGYVNISEIEGYFEPVGMNINIIRSELQSLLDWQLIEPYDPSKSKMSDIRRLHITEAGQAHIEFAMENIFYLSEMAKRTPLRGSKTRDDIIEQSQKLRKKLPPNDFINEQNTMRKIFVEYLLKQDASFLEFPDTEIYKSQILLRDDLRSQWILSSPQEIAA